MSDLISRQAAIDALNEQIERCNKALGTFGISRKDEFAIKVERASLETYKEQLENLPPVQPERIKGHWIEITSRNHTYKCSVCGRLLVNITDGKNNVAKNYPYCHCGADMRTKETDCDYERAVEQLEHDMLYEPTFDPDDGSM